MPPKNSALFRVSAPTCIWMKFFALPLSRRVHEKWQSVQTRLGRQSEHRHVRQSIFSSDYTQCRVKRNITRLHECCEVTKKEKLELLVCKGVTLDFLWRGGDPLKSFRKRTTLLPTSSSSFIYLYLALFTRLLNENFILLRQIINMVSNYDRPAEGKQGIIKNKWNTNTIWSDIFVELSYRYYTCSSLSQHEVLQPWECQC